MTATDDTPVPDYANMLRLDGRRIVVLGAGQGIGRQTSHALAANGARIVCVDVDETLAGEIAEETGGVAWSGDATSRSEMERLFADAERELDGIDGVVDIIGISRYHDLIDATDEEWEFHFDMCLRHAFLAMQYGGAALKRAGGGTLTFIASASGLTGAPRHSIYGAAKAGLMAMVRSAAVEYGPFNIRTNAVAPGVVWTPRVSGYLGEEGKQRNASNAPLNRVALPSNIASTLLFLTSPLADYVNGQVLTVDGGVSAKFPYPMDGL